VIYAVMRWIVRAIARVYLAGMFAMEGRDKVPRRGTLMVCANHSSNVDPPLVPAFLPRSDTWSMAKAEWFHDRRGHIFRAYHAFPVVRHTADRNAIRRALTILREGEALVMYPEGTRVREGGLKRAEPGAGFLALQGGVTVQPVALVGTRAIFPAGSLLPKRGRIALRFGAPFTLVRHRPDGRRVTNQEAADAIMVRVAELMPDDMRGEYGDLDRWRAQLDGVWASV
jgi:1-acyl-sn-glycerol-3-phosphate acyltransferase